mmetsp:Transcript_26728/g.35774  ORF Transcript_26728/g.35774 Transcript_26728/m.35774 type:complete len:80 (-) Transcript_26728:457-696(-)
MFTKMPDESLKQEFRSPLNLQLRNDLQSRRFTTFEQKAVDLDEPTRVFDLEASPGHGEMGVGLDDLLKRKELMHMVRLH